MTNKLIKDIRLAEQSVEQAEAALTTVLARLTAAPRAEKVGVGAPLEAALQSLEIARAALATLRTGQR
jgi:hypothetical protein